MIHQVQRNDTGGGIAMKGYWREPPCSYVLWSSTIALGDHKRTLWSGHHLFFLLWFMKKKMFALRESKQMAMWHAAGFYSGQKLLHFCLAFQCTKHSLESKTFFKALCLLCVMWWYAVFYSSYVETFLLKRSWTSKSDFVKPWRLKLLRIGNFFWLH